MPAGAHLGVHIIFSSNLMSLLFRCQAGYWLLLVLPVVTPHLVQLQSLGLSCLSDVSLGGPTQCQARVLPLRSFHGWPWFTSFRFIYINGFPIASQTDTLRPPHGALLMALLLFEVLEPFLQDLN